MSYVEGQYQEFSGHGLSQPQMTQPLTQLSQQPKEGKGHEFPSKASASKHPRDGYDPIKSAISSRGSTMKSWLQAPITGDIKQIPGIGDANSNLLASNTGGLEGVTSSFELIGKFLLFKGAGVNQVEHCDRFWHWLKQKGIGSQKSSIVQAIALRCNVYFPGLYDENLYKD